MAFSGSHSIWMREGSYYISVGLQDSSVCYKGPFDTYEQALHEYFWHDHLCNGAKFGTTTIPAVELEDDRPDSPLRHLSTDELLAELARRGFDIPLQKGV